MLNVDVAQMGISIISEGEINWLYDFDVFLFQGVLGSISPRLITFNIA